LVLEDFLFPQESIQYQCKYYIKHGGDDYVLYITNRRIIGHKRKGFIFKKDRVFSVALQEVVNLSYQETGIVNKKGLLIIETKTKKEPFEGERNDVKTLWREMQKFLGYTSGRGALPDEPVQTPASNSVSVHIDQAAKATDDPVKILARRLAMGEISMEQYTEMKKLVTSD
jgi:hypothetical protein